MFPLFPASSLDNSILTSVLLGLLVVWFFQETLGWNFTGLVVPGYLASILTIHPATGAVVVAEALLTWGVVALTSDRVPRWWPWARLFGRDRFLLFLTVSVAVRLLLEGGGFALLADRLGVETRQELHSMGLVVVPLLANALWRSGPAGLHRIALPAAITWALLRWVVLPHTNLSLTRFELTYEDLAVDFVSSPRAYVLLLVGAALGSRVNQRWGWDFGGIIVPGLLALCWLQPVRLAATMGEAAVIALLLRALLKLPGLRGANFTGGRPLVTAFALGYLVKFVLGWTLGARWPGFEIRELFGFGYLLSSIVALRALRYGDILRGVVPAVLTSFAAFVGASALGYALAVLLPTRPADVVAPPPAGPGATVGAVLLAAWRDEGPAPAGVGELAARGEPALATGGDGFGGLWVRGGLAELAVSARVGEPGVALAALAVAETLDARAVLICAPEGRACAEAEQDLALRMPLLRVEAGQTSTVRGAGRLAPAVDLGRLGALVGAFQTESGPATASPLRAERVAADTLVLDPTARARAAAARFGADPEQLWEPGAAPPPERPDAAPMEATRLRFLREEVLGPWMAWRTRRAEGEDALRVATALAAGEGLRLTRSLERAALEGPGWRVLVDRDGGAVVVHVPDAAEEPGSLAVGRALAGTLRAGAFVVDAPGTGAVPEAERPVHAALLRLLASVGEAAQVVTVRAFPGAFDPGADVVLSIGRPVPEGAELPAVAAAMRRRLDVAGLGVAVYDGSASRLSFLDAGNAARAAAAAATGREAQVTVWAGARVWRHLAPVDLEHPLEPALASAALPHRPWDVRALVPYLEAGPPGPAWDAVRAALDTFVRTGRSSALAPLRAAAGQGVPLVICDPLLGCRWLAVERCDRDRCDGLLLPLERGEDGPEAPTDAAPDAATGAAPEPGPALPLDAVALGAGDRAYHRPVDVP